MEQVDAAVVGAGAADGIVAKELAVAGLRVMGLDRGPVSGLPTFGRDELFDSQWRWNPHGLCFGPYRGEMQSFRPDYNQSSRVVTPSDADYSAAACCVGDGTRIYQALSWRYHPGTFRLKTLYGVPAGSTVEDWPTSYDELEPYYEKAEYDLGVCGELGPYGPRRQ